MTNIFILKEFNEYRPLTIIEVADDVAVDLIQKGIAREARTRDFLVKPQFGRGVLKNALSKAFRRAPKTR